MLKNTQKKRHSIHLQKARTVKGLTDSLFGGGKEQQPAAFSIRVNTKAVQSILLYSRHYWTYITKSVCSVCRTLRRWQNENDDLHLEGWWWRWGWGARAKWYGYDGTNTDEDSRREGTALMESRLAIWVKRDADDDDDNDDVLQSWIVWGDNEYIQNQMRILALYYSGGEVVKTEGRLHD